MGFNASPPWFMIVINIVINGLDCVLTYLNDVNCFEVDASSLMRNALKFFKRLRKYSLTLSRGNSRVGATSGNFVAHTVSFAGVSPDAVKVEALKRMPSPANVEQLPNLLGGLSYYRKFLNNLSVKAQPLIALLKQGTSSRTPRP